eukprot:scaffold2345_cov51-Attheya_sp.AAC.5
MHSELLRSPVFNKDPKMKQVWNLRALITVFINTLFLSQSCHALKPIFTNKKDQGASTVAIEETTRKDVTQLLNEAKRKNLFSMTKREWKNKWNDRNLRISPVEQKRRRCNRNVFEDFIFLESDCRYNNDNEGVDMDELVGFSFVQFCRLLDTTDYK